MLKDIKGYEGRYKVSEDGKIWSVISNKWLKGFMNTDGYMCVALHSSYETIKRGICCKRHRQKTIPIHILVAMTFIPNVENKPQVNHINENKMDNNVYNLEWVTCDENINHGTRNAKVSKALKNRSYKAIACEQLTLDGEHVKTFTSVSEASRVTGINYRTIIKCLKKQKYNLTAGGYLWRVTQNNR